MQAPTQWVQHWLDRVVVSPDTPAPEDPWSMSPATAMEVFERYLCLVHRGDREEWDQMRRLYPEHFRYDDLTINDAYVREQAPPTLGPRRCPCGPWAGTICCCRPWILAATRASIPVPYVPCWIIFCRRG